MDRKKILKLRSVLLYYLSYVATDLVMLRTRVRLFY